MAAERSGTTERRLTLPARSFSASAAPARPWCGGCWTRIRLCDPERQTDVRRYSLGGARRI